MDLVIEIEQKNKELSDSIRMLSKNGIALAESERNYKVTLAQEALRLKTEGYAVTLIPLIIYGLENVADLRFKRDTAKAVYTANLEHIAVVKLQLRLLESQLSREYSMAGKDNF